MQEAGPDPTIRDERGASLVEYALLIALIAVVCIIAIVFLGNSLNGNYSRSASKLGMDQLPAVVRVSTSHFLSA